MSSTSTSSNTKVDKVKKYIEKVNEYATHLIGNEEAFTKLVELFNQKGQEYFGSQMSGYIKADPEDVKHATTKEIYNKADFIKKKREEQGDSEDTPDEEVLFLNEAAFDDSFRHTIFIDITDIENPKLVNEPAGTLRDSVLTWDKVQILPEILDNENVIAVHLDAMAEIFFPIPTLESSGGKRKRKYKKKSLKRKTRKNKE